MDDWVVALILLAISLVLVGAMVLLCRILGVWRLTSLFTSGEEKTSLTKAQGQNGYVVGDLRVQYDALHTTIDPRYVTTNGDFPTPPPEAATDGAPTPDSVSIASDVELGTGLTRAQSCDSVTSDSSAFDIESDVSKIGQLEFGLEYDAEVSELVISVIQAKDLESSQVTGTLDSYVKLWITPSSMGRFQTKVQKDTVNPVYKERFLCSAEPQELEEIILQFQVFSCDKYARHKLLGEAELRVGDLNLRQPTRIWMNLRDMDEKPTDLGDLLVSVSYLPTAERLTVVLVKGRNIRWIQGRDTGECFVKVYLLKGGKKISKKKTVSKRDERNPIFNEAMIFSVPANALCAVQLRVTVAEQHGDGKVTSVGHVVLGSQVSGTELAHWNQMTSSLRKPVSMWHRLRK